MLLLQKSRKPKTQRREFNVMTKMLEVLTKSLLGVTI